jgi:uncharacterized integral membrane protein
MLYLLILVLLVPLILFGLSNRQDVLLSLWPLDMALTAPLSVAILVAAGCAFLLGALFVWVATWPAMRRARKLERASRLLEAEVADLRAARAREVGPVLHGAAARPALVRLSRPAA